MDNWQLQHSRSLASDEQRHQDIASIGKFDRVVMAMRHIWFAHQTWQRGSWLFSARSIPGRT